MPKLGREYEEALADILRRFEPRPEVTVGEWVDGPDGRRELDVHLKGVVDATPTTILFECKDYNGPRRLGIDIVDGFDSKLRDIGSDIGVLCSNCDFSVPARAKAARLGIGLVGTLVGGKYSLREYFEQRVIRVYGQVQCIPIFEGEEKLALGREWFEDAELFDGVKLTDLSWQYASLAVVKFPIVNGTLHVDARLPEPAEVNSYAVNRRRLVHIELTLQVKGAWLGRSIEIVSTSALYNWLTRTMFPVGAGNTTFKDLVVVNPKHWIKRPALPLSSEYGGEGLSIFRSLAVYGLPDHADSPEVSKHVSYQGLTLSAPIPDEAYTSMPKTKFAALVADEQKKRYPDDPTGYLNQA